MNARPDYFDIRADLWRDLFSRALTYDRYLEDSDSAYSSRWRASARALPALTPDQVRRITGHGRSVNVLVCSGVWCGDCVRQVPMLKQIVEAVGTKASMRIMERDESERLRDELRILGAMRVPVTVFLSEDFHEVARVGDRMLSTYRRKLRTETGAACDPGLSLPPGEELAAEQEEWVSTVERVLIMLRLSPPLRERYGD